MTHRASSFHFHHRATAGNRGLSPPMHCRKRNWPTTGSHNSSGRQEEDQASTCAKNIKVVQLPVSNSGDFQQGEYSFFTPDKASRMSSSKGTQPEVLSWACPAWHPATKTTEKKQAAGLVVLIVLEGHLLQKLAPHRRKVRQFGRFARGQQISQNDQTQPVANLAPAKNDHGLLYGTYFSGKEKAAEFR